ncbi:unnamed protein product [Moneuplotes crassus]|uniref:Uncharacterized protein n=1 Tax=Euplotes crassus TaxID=5936 RepID=A0AAD1UKJ2_EUPCR|nr:unnamed protein product [Moneuplotes crassus]
MECNPSLNCDKKVEFFLRRSQTTNIPPAKSDKPSRLSMFNSHLKRRTKLQPKKVSLNNQIEKLSNYVKISKRLIRKKVELLNNPQAYNRIEQNILSLNGLNSGNTYFETFKASLERFRREENTSVKLTRKTLKTMQLNSKNYPGRNISLKNVYTLPTDFRTKFQKICPKSHLNSPPPDLIPFISLKLNKTVLTKQPHPNPPSQNPSPTSNPFTTP